MALIINGDMPKACAWDDTKGNNYTCFNLNACRIQGPHSYICRPSDCPIIGEIPDKHGRIVDISKVEDFLTKWENGEFDYEPYLDEVLSMIRYSTKTIVEATE